MLIISAGMQKSGSAFFYNVINELVIESGGADARQVKTARQLDGVMKWDNNNIGRLYFYKIIRLWLISLSEGDFVVKTHSGPGMSARILNKLGLIKIIYSYRDPRDALLSAIDHGKKILSSGNDHTFSKMVDFDSAISNVKNWAGIWKKYTKMHGVLKIKYEEMMENPVECAQLIEKFLGLSVSYERREKIIWRFSRNNPDRESAGLHFNKAKTNRYKTEMTVEQIKKCRSVLGKYITDMSYRID